MNLLPQVLAVLVLVAVAPLSVWAERRVKAWVQLRRGPPVLQPYRDLRRLWTKRPLAPAGASRLFLVAPALGFAVVATALFALPLGGPTTALGGGAALLAFGLLLTLERGLLAAQAYDTGTPFGGMGASRELFLGGLGEPVFLLVAAAVLLATGHASVPATPLSAAQPSTWLVAGALALLWVAEASRIPFDNPATHLELTMIHEAGLLEASGWMLGLQEWTAAVKQCAVGAVGLLLLVPFPANAAVRIAALVGAVVVLSGALAFVESGVAKVRLFRASHLLIMAALLAFLGGAVTFLERGLA